MQPIERLDQLHIGDFGKDLDDEVAALVAAALVKQGYINLRGTIANLHPAEQRARIALGTYDSLGLTVPVGIGTPCRHEDSGTDTYQFDLPYLADAARLLDGETLALEILNSAEPQSLHLVLMSGLTDAMSLILHDAMLFADKVASVSIMSGIQTKDGEPALDGDGYLMPDHTSNNDFDYPAARYVYAALQDLGVPMTIFTRNAAWAAAVNRELYDDLGATGHPVGARLQAAQERSIESIWEQVNLDRDDPDRSLPWGPEDNPRNRGWFARQFCGVEEVPVEAGQPVWEHVRKVAQYDGLTVIASHPVLCEEFFEPEDVIVNGVIHKVIGVTPERHGIRDLEALVEFLNECAQTAVSR